MTDPQDDVPCRGCETEGSRSRLDDEGLCPDCRTPSARLLHALSELGISGDHVRATDDETVEVGALIVDIWEGGAFSIKADGHYSEMAGHNAAGAIAAIVQAPGLRKDRAALHEALEKVRGAVSVVAHADEEFVDAVVRLRADRDAMNDGIGLLWVALDRAGVRDDVDDRYMQQVSEHSYEPAGEYRQADLLERVGFLVSERDTLAARVKELEADNARLSTFVSVIADRAEDQDLPAAFRARVRSELATLRDLAGGAS